MVKLRIAIIGAGNSGISMAAHLALSGECVNLWNRSAQTIKDLVPTKSITVQGKVNGKAYLNIVTDSIELAVKDAEMIFVTTPATSHVQIAQRLAPYVDKNIPIILTPGRTFGAIEFKHILLQNGYSGNVNVCETQTIIYTCRKTDSCNAVILDLKKNVLISCLDPSKIESIVSSMPQCLKKIYKPTKSMVETSIGNVGMILHCTPTLLNSGWIESPSHSFKYYYHGISPSISSFLERLDEERIHISEVLGNSVESTYQWMKRSYGVEGETLFQCIQNNEAYKEIDAPDTLEHRYILEDVPCGLVPLESIGAKLGVKTPYVSLIIDLANSMLKKDFRSEGRTLEKLGMGSMLPEQIITILNHQELYSL